MKIKSYVIQLSLGLVLLGCTKSGSSDMANSASGAGGSIARMTIVGNFLYLVTHSALQTYDISKPSEALLLSSQNVGWNIETIFPYRDKLFIGSQTGMFVFDNSDPKKPKLQGQAQHLRACDPVVADESYAYVTLRSNNAGCGGTLNQLNIYDIQGALVMTPKLTATLGMSEPFGLGKKGEVLFVCMGLNGLNIIDVSDKSKPKVLQTLKTGEHFMDVIPYGDVLITYVQGGIILYDISQPTNPKLLSTIKN